MNNQSKINKKKPPLTYYGGKQQLAKKIVELIPEHHLYTEVFFGGGAVYFYKEATQSVINDTNNNLINFYKELKNNNEALVKEIEATLYAQEEHRLANDLYSDKIKIEDIHFAPDKKVKMKKAWAVFVLSHMSFLSIMGNTFRVGASSRRENSVMSFPKTFNQKKLNMALNDYADRLQNTTIFNDDAIRVLDIFNYEHSFHYIDPPYYNANMGHYGGYTLKDFEELLKMCSKLKGKFMLSSYPSEVLERYTKKYGWKTINVNMHKSSSNTNGATKKKTEVITINY